MLIEDRGATIEDRGAMIEDRGAMIKDRGAIIEDRGAVAFLPTTAFHRLWCSYLDLICLASSNGRICIGIDI